MTVTPTMFPQNLWKGKKREDFRRASPLWTTPPRCPNLALTFDAWEAGAGLIEKHLADEGDARQLRASARQSQTVSSGFQRRATRRQSEPVDGSHSGLVAAFAFQRGVNGAANENESKM
jgi:hypothetical protein